MPTAFADTSYWIARTIPGDQWREASIRAEQRLGKPLRIVTTQEVLIEFLAAVAGNPLRRILGIQLIDSFTNNPLIEVVPQTPESFQKGFELYRNRLDKGYSLVDCISMRLMADRGITQALTSDHHFNQEGQYTALMRQP